MPSKKINVKAELLEGIKELCATNREVILVSLSTADGFYIKSFGSKVLNGEADKLAAMSSTISSLSDSSAKQILQNQFDMTIIESDAGNMLFVRTNYLGLPCVLTVAAQSKMALATDRYKTKILAQNISNILI